MVVNLADVTNDLDRDFRDALNDNFYKIETALNEISNVQESINKQLKEMNDKVDSTNGSVKSIGQQNAKNIESLVTILTEYDVAMKLINGSVVEDKEEE